MTRYTVEFVVPEDAAMERAGEVVTVEVDESEYVLAAGRNAGLWLPADCQQGWCTRCAAELLAGDLDQSDAKRYYDVDREADMVLLCTAKPRSDLRVRICQYDEMLDHRAAFDLPPGSSKR